MEYEITSLFNMVLCFISRMAANPRTFTDVQATILSAHANCTVEDKISFYDTWSKLYEQVIM